MRRDREGLQPRNIGISEQILRKIGELTAVRGDGLTARKASARLPLSDSEKVWIELAVKKIIWQLGVREQLRSWCEMSDLPPL
jgi:hypothetical protein